MSLHSLANHMAAHGRGPDDHLVHMSGKEVAGLQAIANMHGGSLTKNPHTGLPEAGFLDSIMPTLVGGAMTFFSDGAISPAMAAGIMGLGTAAKTGDLGKGIMAGMGAYGGAGMAQGATQSGLIDKFGSVPAAPNVAAPSLSLEAPAGSFSSGNAAMDASVGTNGMTNNVASLPDNIDVGGGYNPASNGISAPSPQITAQNLGGWKNIGMAAAPAIMDLMTSGKQTPAGTNQMIRPYTFAANSQVSGNTVGGKPMIGTKYTPGQDTSERQWFNPQYTALTPYKAAEGGLMDLSHGGMPVERMSTMADDANNMMTNTSNYAAGGGISSLGGYSDGGQMLKGPGDGMSDNIPAQIGEKQPARLADGEFVVPADVVSHLGNGSTDAGAKQLYKMMDKVRTARTGRKSQGKQINPNRFVPA